MSLREAGLAPGLLKHLLAAHSYNNFNLLVADRSVAYIFTLMGSGLHRHDLAPVAYEVAKGLFAGARLPAGSEGNEAWLANHSAQSSGTWKVTPVRAATS